MTADLSGLTPIREFSRKTLEAAYPGGQAEVPEKDLLDDINRRLYGTGTSMGIYGQFAGRGIVPVPTAEGKMDIPPELNYSSVRAILQSKQDLLNQTQARQINALNASRGAELAEPTFRVSEAGASGYYEGSPTPQTAYTQMLEKAAADRNKLESMKALSGGLGSLAERSGLLDWFFGTQAGRAGTGGGGVVGAATQGVVGNLINMGFSGLSAGAKALWEWMSGGTISEADKAEVLANQAVYQQEIEQLTNQLAEWGPGFNAGANPADLSGTWPGAGYDPYNPGDMSWLSLDALTAPAAAGAGAGAAGADLLAAVPAVGTPAAGGAGALSGLAAGGPATAIIAALAYLLNPQMSPIPAMRDKSDEINANEARQYAQRLMTYSPEQLERDVIQPAANGDPGINGMGIEMLPSPQYDAFKARYRAARDHTGEFAGHPSLSYPTQNDVRVQEALAGLQLQGITLTPEQYAWANVPDTGR